MCDPVTTLVAASTVFNFIGDSQAANAQEDVFRASEELRQESIRNQRTEIDKNTDEEKGELAMEALRHKGRLRVSTGESGLHGNFSDLLLNDVKTQLGLAQTRVETSRQRQQKQLDLNDQAGVQKTNNRSASIQQPNLVSAGLQIAGSYYGNKQVEPKRKV